MIYYISRHVIQLRSHAHADQGSGSSFGVWNHCYACFYIRSHISSISLLDDTLAKTLILWVTMAGKQHHKKDTEPSCISAPRGIGRISDRHGWEHSWGYLVGASSHTTGKMLQYVLGHNSCSAKRLGSVQFPCGNAVPSQPQGWSGNHSKTQESECLLARRSVDWREGKVTWEEGQGKDSQQSRLCQRGCKLWLTAWGCQQGRRGK